MKRTGIALVVSIVAAAGSIAAQKQVSAGTMLPPGGDSSFGFQQSTLVDPDTVSRRFATQLSADTGGTVYAGLEHVIPHATTAQVPVSYPLWASGDGGASWSSPVSITPPSCAPGELVGQGNISAPVRGTAYAVQNCATVNTVFVSHDQGGSWQPTGQSITGAADDEARVTADPSQPQTLYIVTHIYDTNTRTIQVSKSVDGGASFLQVTFPNATESVQQRQDDFEDSIFAPLLIDPHNSQHLYVLWTAETVQSAVCQSVQSTNTGWFFQDTIFVAESADGGATWNERELLNADPIPSPCVDATNPSYDPHTAFHDFEFFPEAAVDAAGNIYFVVAESFPGTAGAQQSHIMLTRSGDGGNTFSTTQIDQGGIPSNVGPSVVAGGDGAIDVAWFASTAPDQTDFNAQWAVMMARITQATSANPIIQQTRASDVVYTGGFCPRTCGADPDQTKAAHAEEHWMVALAADSCGDAQMMWLRDTNEETADPTEGIPTEARQVRGPGITPPSAGCVAPSDVPEAQLSTAGLPIAGILVLGATLVMRRQRRLGRAGSFPHKSRAR